ncbi:hypothetical protein ABW02_05530 [Niallia circulans]|uniref:Uncharacterized protein n=1 Tax=Niallia circulans TaxID=1397 RepID=A0A0J1LF59_NIACI|nr:hypothetical protein ABW02_05530 [Niallia circulans]
MKFSREFAFLCDRKGNFFNLYEKEYGYVFSFTFFLEMGFDTASNPDKHKRAVNVSHLLPHPT